jgi:hypothetical protein
MFALPRNGFERIDGHGVIHGVTQEARIRQIEEACLRHDSWTVVAHVTVQGGAC